VELLFEITPPERSLTLFGAREIRSKRTRTRSGLQGRRRTPTPFSRWRKRARHGR
jgi:hypothetical protein